MGVEANRLQRRRAHRLQLGWLRGGYGQGRPAARGAHARHGLHGQGGLSMGPAPRRMGGANVPVWDKYSLAERDRRWAAVRGNAAKAGFDCTFVPLGNGTDARYLTQLRCSSIVLPTDGRPPIVIADRGSSNDWVPETQLTSREWAEPMAQALLDLG